MGNLRQKLLLSYALLVAGVLIGGGWSIYHFTVLGRYVRLIMSNNYRSVLDAERMKETLERQDSAMTFHVAGNDRKAIPQYEANRALFQRSYADAAANITEPGEREVIRDIGTLWHTYTEKAGRFLYRSPASPRSSATYFAEMEPAFIRLKNRCDDLLQLNQDGMLSGQHRAEREAAAASRATEGLSAALLLLGTLYSFQLSARLVAPLSRLTAAARRIGEGDLDLQIEERTRDEVETLATEFNRMAGSLRQYRQREAARLYVAEQQAEAAINNLYEPVIVTGQEGEILSLNRAAEALFGCDSERERRPVEALRVTPVSDAVREAILRRQPVASEGERGLASIRADGSERCYRIRTAPLLRAAEEVSGTVTVLEDVTRLREIDRLKDEFISVASHELRTPLTSLQMAVRLLAEGTAGALNPQQERLLGMAVRDGERLERLTRDLLDLTRLEAGTALPHLQRISPGDLVESALTGLIQPATRKGVTLRAELAPSLPTVQGDPDQLARVLVNLVGNAIRHTPAGGSIRISGAVRGPLLELAVHDTGEGIAAEYLPRIFERFVQVPGATSGGAGLGLPIARKIVEAHGGTIRAESEPGHGSTFRFTIPLHSHRESEEHPHEQSKSPDHR